MIPSESGTVRGGIRRHADRFGRDGHRRRSRWFPLYGENYQEYGRLYGDEEGDCDDPRGSSGGDPC
jgi:hypothetical protein